VRNLNEAETPHEQLAVLLGTQCKVCDIFLCLECKDFDKTFGGHIIPHLYENCVVLFSVVLCSCYRICLFVERGMMESEPTLGGMCYNNVIMLGFVTVC
jgi:hypothetical protein